MEELAKAAPGLLQGLSMVGFLAVGRLLPRVTGVALLNHDLVLNLLNGFVLFLLRVSFVAHVASWSQVGLVDLSLLGPGWVQLLVCFVVLDFSRYWLHYADHRVPWLWTFHRVHHSAEYLDSTTGLRMHLVDFLQLSALTIVLFGVIFDASAAPVWVVPAAMSVGVLMDGFQHANIAMDMKRPVNRAWNQLLNNPHFHSWHHTRDGALCDGNYGNSLTIWDCLFKTEVTRDTPPELYGLGGDQRIQNTLWGWLLLKPQTDGISSGTGG